MANRTSEQALHVGQRPYVEVTGASVDADVTFEILNPQPHKVTHPGDIHLTVKVSGPTPAQRVRVEMDCKSGDWGLTFSSLEGVAATYLPGATAEYICSPYDLRGRNPLVAPQGSFVDQNKEILPGAIWVKGKITYEDIFGAHHKSEFCYQNGNGWNRRDLSQCKEGNRMD